MDASALIDMIFIDRADVNRHTSRRSKSDRGGITIKFIEPVVAPPVRFCKTLPYPTPSVITFKKKKPLDIENPMALNAFSRTVM